VITGHFGLAATATSTAPSAPLWSLTRLQPLVQFPYASACEDRGPVYPARPTRPFLLETRRAIPASA
jgi:hypothetical protein